MNLGHFQATICCPCGNSNNKATSKNHVLHDLNQLFISQATRKNLDILPLDYPSQCVIEVFLPPSPSSDISEFNRKDGTHIPSATSSSE